MTNTTTKKGAVKGAVAAAAGIAVLLGGAGTFALWNMSTPFAGATVTTGELSVTGGTPMVWDDITPGHENTIEDIGTFRMAPGDVIESTATMTVIAQGENIVVKPAITAPDGGDYVAALPPALQDDLSIDITLSGDGIDEDGELTAGTHDVTVTTIFRFAEDAGDTKNDRTTMNQTVDLTTVNITLQQVAPSASGS
ncbi:alternate-type signal peptide domain-containing protein [Isoptericola sp. F-RaC21]|uniref:alternate-type signal peptide domain-containing protein n=1 Tax=Isoptericola sp. F-RaC21 TaxID=3141452 RepID=UPI00315C4202